MVNTFMDIKDLKDLDFVFSFANEDRKLVEGIYEVLKRDNINVFYDTAYEAQMVGKDLYTFLRDLYKNKGKYVVCFISEHYTKKVWTNLELSAIKERLMTTFFAGDFLIPILIDKSTMLEDIPCYIKFYRYNSINETVEMLKKKINSSLFEDNFLYNINNCISYLLEQVCTKLIRRNIDVVLNKDKNTLKISGIKENFNLCFSPDPIAQTACILVTREKEFKKAYFKENFPIIIITWRKQENLFFSIHEFDSITKDTVENKQFTDVVNYICVYIETCLGGQ